MRELRACPDKVKLQKSKSTVDWRSKIPAYVQRTRETFPNSDVKYLLIINKLIGISQNDVAQYQRLPAPERAKGLKIMRYLAALKGNFEFGMAIALI